jgi:hypothetical protein
MTGAGFGAAGVPQPGQPRRQRMSARQATIDRYRHLRTIAKQHLSGALKHLSQTAIKEAAQRVGLWSRGMLVMDSPDEMDLVFDVAVFDTKSGRSRALDRYARAHPPAAGSDEAVTLDALQHSRFHIIRVLQRHEIAGLVVEDTVTHESLWLMDEGLEVTARSGMGLATRLARVNGFHMTTGAAVPVTAEVLKEAIASRSAWQNEHPSRFVDDPRFPEAVYAAAIRQGKMQFIKFRDPKDL